MTTATTTSLGEIKLAGDLAGVNNGLAPELTTISGVAGSFTLPTVTIDSKGRITAISNGTSGSLVGLLPVASSSVAGGVKIGSNITLSGGSSDTINIPVATSSVKGVASFSSDFTVTAGAVTISSTPNIPTASSTVRGGVKIGSGLLITGGVVDVPIASSSQKGIAKVGAGLTATAGVIDLSSPLTAATNSVAGAVMSADTNNITITAGAIDVGPNIPKLNTANTYTKPQVVSPSVLTPGTTVTPNFALSNIFTLVAGQNFTLANPTGVVAGGVYHISIQQDGTGNRLITWGSNYKFNGGVPALTATASQYDLVSIIAITTSFLICTLHKGFA
jgi:hypothetical protein